MNDLLSSWRSPIKKNPFISGVQVSYPALLFTDLPKYNSTHCYNTTNLQKQKLICFELCASWKEEEIKLLTTLA